MISPEGIICCALGRRAQIVCQKIQGGRADDFDRARDQDPGLQRQVEATALEEAGPSRFEHVRIDV